MNEHILDHSTSGKTCLLIEIELVENAPASVKQSITSMLNNLNEVHTFFGIEKILHFCESFRANHTLHFPSQFVENFSEHKSMIKDTVKWLQTQVVMYKLKNDFVCNSMKNTTICKKWILGTCDNENILAAAFLMKRETTKQSIIEVLDKLDYVSKWKVNSENPVSEVSVCNVNNKQCSCKQSEPNMFCSILYKARSENNLQLMEYADNCILPGQKEFMNNPLRTQGMLEKEMLDFFTKKIESICIKDENDNLEDLSTTGTEDEKSDVTDENSEDETSNDLDNSFYFD